MSDIWELICHHTYTGIPGVIVDLSGTGASNGRAFGLPDADFLADGASSGSGAVDFHNPHARVRVSATAQQWKVIEGIKAEVTLRIPHPLDPRGWKIKPIKPKKPLALFSHYIIDSDAFTCSLSGRGSAACSALAYFYQDYPLQADIPVGKWFTIGFMHDGFGTTELSLDGHVIDRHSATLYPLRTPGANGISIGNSCGNTGEVLNGQIDEVKVWRLNPRRFDEQFRSRPMDKETADCWARLERELDEALRRNPKCARKLMAAVSEALRSIRRQVVAHGAETEARIAKAAREYNELWRAGKVGGPEMARVFAELIACLRLAGVPIQTNPAIAQLADSECLRVIRSEITRPDCDRQSMRLLDSIEKELGAASQPVTAR